MPSHNSSTQTLTSNNSGDSGIEDNSLEQLIQELNLYCLKELPDLSIIISDLDLYLQT